MADNFVDYDFTTDPRYVAGYAPGIPSRESRTFADAFELIPESQWRDLCEQRKAASMARLVTRIFDQSNEGSCVGNAGVQAHQVLQAKTLGKSSVVQMSAMSLYKQIGSSPSSGAMVEDAIDRLSDTGILPLDTAENKGRFAHTMSHTGFRQSWPSGWKDTAKKFAGLEGFACDTVAEMVSALFRGMPIHVGRAGHSILYLDPVWLDGSIAVLYVNSWSEQWGSAAGSFAGGFGIDTARYYRESADWCYAYQAVNPVAWEWAWGGAA